MAKNYRDFEKIFSQITENMNMNEIVNLIDNADVSSIKDDKFEQYVNEGHLIRNRLVNSVYNNSDGLITENQKHILGYVIENSLYESFWDDEITFMDNINEGFMDYVKKAGDWVYNAAKKTGEVVAGAASAVGDWVKDAYTFLKQKLTQLLDATKGLLNSIFGNIKVVFENIQNGNEENINEGFGEWISKAGKTIKTEWYKATMDNWFVRALVLLFSSPGNTQKSVAPFKKAYDILNPVSWWKKMFESTSNVKEGLNDNNGGFCYFDYLMFETIIESIEKGEKKFHFLFDNTLGNTTNLDGMLFEETGGSVGDPSITTDANDIRKAQDLNSTQNNTSSNTQTNTTNTNGSKQIDEKDKKVQEVAANSFWGSVMESIGKALNFLKTIFVDSIDFISGGSLTSTVSALKTLLDNSLVAKGVSVIIAIIAVMILKKRESAFLGLLLVSIISPVISSLFDNPYIKTLTIVMPILALMSTKTFKDTFLKWLGTFKDFLEGKSNNLISKLATKGTSLDSVEFMTKNKLSFDVLTLGGIKNVFQIISGSIPLWGSLVAVIVIVAMILIKLWLTASFLILPILAFAWYYSNLGEKEKTTKSGKDQEPSTNLGGIHGQGLKSDVKDIKSTYEESSVKLEFGLKKLEGLKKHEQETLEQAISASQIENAGKNPDVISSVNAILAS